MLDRSDIYWLGCFIRRSSDGQIRDRYRQIYGASTRHVQPGSDARAEILPTWWCVPWRSTATCFQLESLETAHQLINHNPHNRRRINDNVPILHVTDGLDALAYQYAAVSTRTGYWAVDKYLMWLGGTALTDRPRVQLITESYRLGLMQTHPTLTWTSITTTMSDRKR